LQRFHRMKQTIFGLGRISKNYEFFVQSEKCTPIGKARLVLLPYVCEYISYAVRRSKITRWVNDFWAAFCLMWAWLAQSVQRLATMWTVRGSNLGGGVIFRTRSHCPWGLPSLLRNGYGIIPKGKAAEAWHRRPIPSSAEVTERIQLYLHSSLRLHSKL